MKLAIIGAGISGLVAAYRLHPEHELTLFEAADYPGGHTNTVDVEDDGRRLTIDTGFIVFSDWTYPNFIALLDELGVPSQPTTMSVSVRDAQTGLEYNGHSLNTLFAQRGNLLRPGFYRMLADVVRFNRDARRLVDLFRNFDRDLSVSRHWTWNGTHYQRTAEAWLANLDARRGDALPIPKSVYGERDAARWFHRWRMFLMAVAELFGFARGEEWFVAHSLPEVKR